MNSIICEKNRSLKLAEQAEPVRGEGEAIVAIQRIGICGTDLHAYQGNQPYFTYPRILGHELAGIVESIDEHEKDIVVGDQVSIIPYMHCGACTACRSNKTNCCKHLKVLGVHVDGGMRERISVPTSHLIATADLNLDQTAMLEPLAIGAHAIRRSGLKQGDIVLVIGAGPIGLGIMKLASQAGAHVIAMDLNEERLRFCQSWAGVKQVIEAHLSNDHLQALNDGEYPSIVFDATGSQQSMTRAFDLVAHGGTLVFVGLVKTNLSFSDPDFHSKELTLMGSRNATREDFEYVKEAMLNGQIDIDSYITHRSSFHDMIQHIDHWLLPESKVIKAIVDMDNI
ncbi:zinc-binding alcohol dehydrogenase family protein [Paenibacillus aquistagni]|uniref:2-desacetyl-2-hydroxyethyl bacteriochlorophyllide A dehydrogenase n=1 Tax=Paenibacillus aquistagni TaxID=1852522 RepID=A0A1X7J408_9BACL|nr:zinc-binding alcohol dehydrogenase family protein [Paenibacillus aquistagni]SMG22380.1 2-desacetyl-2-hydroxyethyl bacteriochlorophyllide A dehydrogenase [Paenibacillus aquistagni]